MNENNGQPGSPLQISCWRFWTWNDGETSEAEPIDSNEELIGAMGGINEDASTGIDENISAGYLSDVKWKEEDPLIKINDENVTISQMPAAASTPIQASTENGTLSPLESPMGKKPCFQESTAACLSKAASPLHLEPDYRDAELVGYTWPPLSNVIPWINYEAQNMVEPTFRQELQCIRKVDHLQYIIAMIVWLCRWRQEHRLWPLLPACGFQVRALAMATIKTQVVSVTSEIQMTLGERQVLRVLTTLQYLAEVGPKSPTPGHIAQCVQSIMWPLQQVEIPFMPHAVLGYATCVNLIKKYLSQN